MRGDDKMVVVIGAGLAGVSAVTGLRAADFDGRIVVVSEEREPPYDRPPLSKQFLIDGDEQRIRLTSAGIDTAETLLGRRAVAIDPAARTVVLDDGTTLHWWRLVIATGAVPRRLRSLETGPVPAQVLRTLDDARAIRERLTNGVNLVVIGGGPIGLELAATARTLGAQSTVVELADRLMGRCASPTLSRWLSQRHRENGVNLRIGRQVVRSNGDRTIELDDGERLPADLIVVGIGIRANDGLAVAAGIACDDGIFVDALGRTSAVDIYAAGDVTRQFNPSSGRIERIETWANAQNQALAVGRAVADPPTAKPYAEVPWFWSDQGDIRIQSAGAPCGDVEVVRGDPASRKFQVMQLSDGVLVGAVAVNSAREFGMLRRLLAVRAAIDPQVLADPAADLAGLVKRASGPAS